MKSDIRLLELADGIKDSLINAGFTIKSIIECTTSDISSKLGVDPYIVRIIFEEARRVTNEMTKTSPVPDESTFTSPAVAFKKEEIL